MYTVNHWGSHPDEKNDDCYHTHTRMTREAAVLLFLETASPDVAYIQVDGPDIHRVRENSAYKGKASDVADRQELAMEAGMLGGCDAYNDAMGYGNYYEGDGEDF